MNEKRRSLDALTGLRFVAAFVVLIDHTVNAAWHGQSSLTHYSGNAVSFFFVLSGFILTYVYSSRLNKQNVLSFYRARWARIWPLHVVCMLLGLAGWLLWTGTTEEMSMVLIILSLHTTLTQSWWPWDQLAFWFNGPAWSVSTEFGFYVFFPFLLMLNRKRFWPALIVVAIITCAALSVSQFYVLPNYNGPTTRYFLYVNPLCRLFEFVVGMMFGRIFISISKTDSAEPAKPVRGKLLRDTIVEVAAIAGICVSLCLFAKQGPIANLFPPGTNAAQYWLEKGAGSSISFGICLLAFGITSGLLSKVLSCSTAVYLGEISYALYLVQNPVLRVIRNLPATQCSSPFVIYLTLNLICFGLAVCLHHLVEKPCRHFIVARSRSDRWQVLKSLFGFSGNPSRRNWISVAAVAGMFIAIAGLYVNHKMIEQGKSGSAAQWMLSAETIVKPPIIFKDEAKLMAFDVETTANAVDVTIAWDILPTQQLVRIFHIVDQDNKVVRQRMASPRQFANRGLYLDHCSISKSDLPSNCRVGIVFYAKGQSCPPVSRGSRTMNKRRLEFFSWDGRRVKLINHGH